MNHPTESNLAERLGRVQDAIAAAVRRAGRSAEDVTLVAVSKTVDARAVLEALRHGVLHLGENRVQEAEAKIVDVAAMTAALHLPVPNWHLVGHLQTNKAATAAQLFSMIESVDSVRVATALDRSSRERGKPIDILLEVNVGREASKFGFAPEQVREAFVDISRLSGVRVVGLMTVAPPVETAEAARPYFRELRQLRDKLVAEFPSTPLPHLSMGMTGDFPVAIEEGATIVRVGRAIFGERPPVSP